MHCIWHQFRVCSTCSTGVLVVHSHSHSQIKENWKTERIRNNNNLNKSRLFLNRPSCMLGECIQMHMLTKLFNNLMWGSEKNLIRDDRATVVLAREKSRQSWYRGISWPPKKQSTHSMHKLWEDSFIQNMIEWTQFVLLIISRLWNRHGENVWISATPAPFPFLVIDPSTHRLI